MIGLDTNVIVRYLVRDDPMQLAKVIACFAELTPSRPGFISLIVVVETAWVLKSVYKYTDAVIATAIERLLMVAELTVQNEQQVFSALVMFKLGRASLEDALIGALGTEAGCDYTLTFDRKAAARLPEFELL